MQQCVLVAELWAAAIPLVTPALFLPPVSLFSVSALVL
jgi:hypothetical protein